MASMHIQLKAITNQFHKIIFNNIQLDHMVLLRTFVQNQLHLPVAMKTQNLK